MKHSCGSRRLSRVVLVQNVSASSTLGQVHTVVNVAHVYAYVYSPMYCVVLRTGARASYLCRGCPRPAVYMWVTQKLADQMPRPHLRRA